MWFGAWLARAKLTFLAGFRTASGTPHRQRLLLGYFHKSHSACLWISTLVNSDQCIEELFTRVPPGRLPSVVHRKQWRVQETHSDRRPEQSAACRRSCSSKSLCH